MKRYNALYNKIDLKYINHIYKTQIRKNTKNKNKIKKFEDFYSINICRIKEIFDTQKYIPRKYNIFLIKEPKYRIIMSQNILDKLINHVIASILTDVLEPSLINMNVATRKEKGTHYAIKYLKKYLNELKGKEIYVLKFDITKYFYKIDHEILKQKLKTKIKDKKFLDFLFTIIDSTNKDVNDKINKLKNNEIKRIKKLKLKNEKAKLKEIENIPLYEKGKGLGIGCMSSQIMAIFYLNDLDHFILEKLKVRYIRFMDDGILLSNNKEYLKYCLEEINKIITKNKLTLNNKTKIININKEGLEFLGFRFYIKHDKIIMKVKTECKRRYKKKLKLIKENKISNPKAKSILASYQSHFKWGNCYNLLKTRN